MKERNKRKERKKEANKQQRNKQLAKKERNKQTNSKERKAQTNKQTNSKETREDFIILARVPLNMMAHIVSSAFLAYKIVAYSKQIHY